MATKFEFKPLSLLYVLVLGATPGAHTHSSGTPRLARAQPSILPDRTCSPGFQLCRTLANKCINLDGTANYPC